MNFDGYMNPMFSDMDNKYIYPMPYVNPMIYMNPYMINQSNYQNSKKQTCTNENSIEQMQNPCQTNPMMYMNPYMMNPMMGYGIDPNIFMQMYMQMMQMMQMMSSIPNMNPIYNSTLENLMPDSIGSNYSDTTKQQIPNIPMMNCMPMMGYMPNMPNINIEEFDEEEM